jgi:hypothetical protein
MILVIRERDLEDRELTIIGVADSVENAEKVIKEYYGDYEVIGFRNIQDSNMEYCKTLEVEGIQGKSHRVDVTLEWFELNRA